MSSHPIDAALEQAPWLRALATQLVRDPALAEELVQDTWVRVFERPPESRSKGALRAWLARVLRNELRQRRRGEQRLKHHEQRAARAEAGPSSDELYERFAVQRKLVEAVDRLESSSREVVLLRFFDGLPPRKIAKRLEVPVRTVESRLRRALAQLRGQLDDLHGGDRRVWVLALASVADLQPQPIGLATGVALVTAKTFVGTVVLGLAALVGWNLWERERPREDQGATARASETSLSATTAPLAVAQDEVTREVVQGGPNAAQSIKEASEKPGGAGVDGQAVLPGGAPAPNVDIVLVPHQERSSSSDSPRATTDSEGQFSLPIEASEDPLSGRILCDDVDFAALVIPRLWEARRFEPLLVVAPNGPLSGIVTDPVGRPLAGVGVRLEIPEGVRSRIDAVIEYSDNIEYTTVTDAEGHWELAPCPIVEGAVLAVLHADYVPLEIEEPVQPRSDWNLTLQPLESSTGVVAGIVVDPDGNPVSGAMVGLGDAIDMSEEDGHFEFRLDEVERPDRLLAVHADWLPVRAEGTAVAEGFVWPPFVELRFASEPLALTGRVLDDHGQPLEGARVWINDPELVGYRNGFALHIEHVLSRDSRLWHYAKTNASGHFKLPGLTDRDYAVVALDGASALMSRAVLARPGTPVLIEMPQGALAQRLTGSVVDRRGDPVAGVRLSIERNAYSVTTQDGSVWMDKAHGAFAESDEQGEFVLENVPYEGTTLRAGGTGFLDGSKKLQLDPDPDPLLVTIARQCHLRIEIASAHLDVDSVQLVDALGEPLAVQRSQADTTYVERMSPLVDGQQTLVVPDTAVLARLYRGEEEVVALPVDLLPNELNRLTP